MNTGERMHVFLYDPHDVLTGVSAERLEPRLGDFIVSDHEVPSVTFEIRPRRQLGRR